MGCGSSTYPVADEGPNTGANFQEAGVQEKHVSHQRQGKVKKSEEATSGDKAEEEGKKEIITTTDVSNGTKKVRNTGEVFEDTGHGGPCTVRADQGEDVTGAASVHNEYRDKDANRNMGAVETALQDEAETVVQATAAVSSNQELGDSGRCSISENPEEQDVQMEKEMASSPEARSRDLVPDKDLSSSIGVAETNMQEKTETSIQVATVSSNQDYDKKKIYNISSAEDAQIDKEITSLLKEISSRPSSLDTKLQKATDSHLDADEAGSDLPSCIDSNQTLDGGESGAAQDNEQFSDTNCLTPLPAVDDQSNSSLLQPGKLQDEIVLEKTCCDNDTVEKGSEKSLHEHENTETTLPESGSKISNEKTVVESLGVDLNKNSESALSSTALKQETNVNAGNEETSSGIQGKEDETNPLL